MDDIDYGTGHGASDQQEPNRKQAPYRYQTFHRIEHSGTRVSRVLSLGMPAGRSIAQYSRLHYRVPVRYPVILCSKAARGVGLMTTLSVNGCTIEYEKSLDSEPPRRGACATSQSDRDRLLLRLPPFDGPVAHRMGLSS